MITILLILGVILFIWGLADLSKFDEGSAEYIKVTKIFSWFKKVCIAIVILGTINVILPKKEVVYLYAGLQAGAVVTDKIADSELFNDSLDLIKTYIKSKTAKLKGE